MDLLELVRDIKIKVDLVYTALVGDPTNQQNPGALTRLDRLEQSFGFLRKCFWVVFTALIGSVTALFFK